MKVMDRFRRVLLPGMALGALVIAGCSGSENTQDQGELTGAARPMSAEVQDFVNQGNEAQRAGDFEAAMTAYQSAMDLDPEHPVPQFGALMVAMATGDQALADSLTAELRESAPELVGMLSPDGSMGGGMAGGGMGGNPHAGVPSAPPIESGEAAGGLPSGHPSLTNPTTPDTTGGR